MSSYRLLALLLLALPFFGCSSGDEPAPSPVCPPMRVMSFNVRYGTAADGPDAWPLRRDLVVRTIRAHDPDLLGMQEVLPLQSDYLAAALPEYERYGPGRDAGGAGEACTIFWRRDRFELVESRTHWLSETPDVPQSKSWDAALTRIVSLVRLRERTNGTEFVFANAHFDHRGATARLESARLLARLLPEDRVILTGDLNAAESSPPLAALRDAGFVDSFRVLHPDATEVGTFTGFRAPGRDKIDHVLYRGRAEVLESGIDRTREGGRWPSDHLPVTARLRWR